jgi:membrane-associated phospholipid phosphatase
MDTTVTEPLDAADRARHHRRVLLTLALTAVIALAVVYLLGVRTTWGQRLDATALSGRESLRPRTVRAAADLLGTIDVASLILVGGAIVLVPLERRQPLLALSAGVLIGGSVLTTEVLKHVVLPRPYLGIQDPLGRTASFPSGHTTVAMSLAVAAMIVIPRRFRPLVGLLGALYAIGVGVGVVATANHRPSDPIGAVLVVTAWAGVVAAALVTVSVDTPADEREPPVSPLFALAGVSLLAIAFVGLLGTMLAIKLERLGTVALGGAFAGAAAAITGTVVLAMTALLAALRGVSLDPPGPADDHGGPDPDGATLEVSPPTTT